MIPLIREELLLRKKWVSEEEFLDLLALAQSFPGVMAVNFAVVAGYRLAGLPGAFLAIGGAALPSFLIILVIASLFTFTSWAQSPWGKAFFRGARPAVVALLLAATYQTGRGALKEYKAGLICGGAFFLLYFLHLHPIFVIIGAALCGLAVYPGLKTKSFQAEDEDQ